MQAKVRVVLYTKAGCGLCQKMKEEMRQAACESLYTLQEVDIEQNPDLFAKYRYDIPVLSINGVEAFRHRLNAKEFRAYLSSLAGAG